MKHVRAALVLVLLSALVTCSALACSSFGADGVAPANDADADTDAATGGDASVPDPVQPDASATTDAESVPTCPSTSLCDGFEREGVRGEWQYPPSSAQGTSMLAIDALTAASGGRSLVVTTGKSDTVRVNALAHTFVAAPTLPFEIHFALRVDELPGAQVRLLRVAFSTGSSVWVGLGTTGIDVGMDAVMDTQASSSGWNPGELAPLGTWGRYTLTVESTRALLALDKGTRSAAIVPYAAEFGFAASTDVGVVQAAPSNSSARFWLDDVVLPR